MTIPALAIASIFFLAATTRGIFGFGAALVAMPLLTLVLPITSATPLMGLVGMTLSVTLAIWYRREISFAAARPLILGALVGMPVGIWFIIDLPESLVVGTLGAALILYGLYSLSGRAPTGDLGKGWGYAAGFVSGGLGAAFNTSGPPAVAYSAAQGWEPAQFRAFMSAYLLFVQTAAVIAQAAAGLWTRELWIAYAVALPTVLLGMAFGTWVARLFSAETYSKAVYILIVILGTVLLLRAL